MSPAVPSPIARERGCIELLEELRGSRFVLIGGYAVSSYGYPRFSVDLDLVVLERDAVGVRDILRRRGLKMDGEWRRPDQLGGSFERWSNGLVNVDLLIDGVIDRRSGAFFGFSLVEARSSNRAITGRSATAMSTAPVAAPEVLVVLKLCAGRLVDIRDICMLSRMELREEEIEPLLSSVPAEAIRWTLDRLSHALKTQNFKDSFKGEFMMKEPRYQECVASALKLCDLVGRLVSRHR